MPQARNSPLTARSVLASALLGADPPDLPVAHLVRLAALFGISENSARVALSRMVTAGEAATRGDGRYRLAGRLLERRTRQESSRAGSTDAWDGTWHLVVVTTAGSAADVRSRRRSALAFARLAELREGTWLRPDNLPVELPGWLRTDVVRFSGRPEDPRRLAERLWDLAGWAEEARVLLDRLRALDPTEWTDLAPGFVLSAAVLRHLQHDPLLPLELVPPEWPGVFLRHEYEGWDHRYRQLLSAWGRDAR